MGTPVLADQQILTIIYSVWTLVADLPGSRDDKDRREREREREFVSSARHDDDDYLKQYLVIHDLKSSFNSERYLSWSYIIS